jgi:flagellar hook-associated protein 2
MGISSPGVGSGLDVNSIVSQLVAIERQPLKTLQTKAINFQAQLSLYGTIKSQVSALADAAAALATTSGWSVFSATSSNTAAVTATASSTATATSFGLDVTQLARAQTSAAQAVATGASLGVAGDTGTLSIQLGSWATGAFAAGAGGPVAVTINGTDSMSTIAGKINAAGAGVTATVINNGTQDQLVLRSSTTGQAAGFQITAAADPASPSGTTWLDSLSLTTTANPANGSAAGMGLSQSGLDSIVKLNGVTVQSATNTLTNIVPGVTLQLNQLTTATANIAVAQDSAALQKTIQTFADAFTALNKTLADVTKYVPGGKSGALQADATTVGLQNVLASVFGSTSLGSTFSRLSEVGLERQTDGSLKLNVTKLTAAMQDMPNLQKLFTTDNGNPTTNGFGLKVRDFARGLIAATGTISTKATAIQGAISRNTKDQDRVNERADRMEVQLRRQYSALDAQMAQMQALSSYVNAQLAQWNKPS